MNPLPLQTERVIRGYEPIFRNLLSRWLESHIEQTGNENLRPDDVSAGVAHVFSTIKNAREVQIGNEKKSLEEYAAGDVLTSEEVLHELSEVAT